MIIPFTNFLKGVNTNISPLIHPPDAPYVLNGCTNSYKLGALVKDTGYSRVGTAALESGKSILGLYQFIQDSTTEKILATVNDATNANTQLFYRANGAGAWANISLGTSWNGFANMNVEMQGFIGYCFFVGADSAGNFLPVGSLTGTTFSTVTNVASMPQAKYIVRYRDRLYLLNVRYGATNYPFRIVASSPVTAGAITWNTAGSPDSSTGGFLDVDFCYQITGGAANWDRLMVFTDQSAYYYDQSSFKKIWDEGCSNHRTIKTKDAYMFWANTDGVWVSTGGQPQNISGEVIDFIRNGNPANFFAEIVDEIYHLYVGTVTVNGVTYSNVDLKYNIATSGWEWREYYNNMTIFARYFDSTKKNRLYMGATSGEVWNKGKYTDGTLVSGDAQTTAGTGGQKISTNFELAPITLDDYKIKIIREMSFFADRAQGLNMRGRVLDRNSKILTPYKPIGQLVQYISSFNVNIDNGVILQIQGSESSTNPYFSFYGFTLDVDKQSEILRKTNK